MFFKGCLWFLVYYWNVNRGEGLYYYFLVSEYLVGDKILIEIWLSIEKGLLWVWGSWGGCVGLESVVYWVCVYV